jgi:CheY-like chemotaxis protein
MGHTPRPLGIRLRAEKFRIDLRSTLEVRTPSGSCPRQDSNLRTRLRRPALYPLSYGGSPAESSNALTSQSERVGHADTLRYPAPMGDGAKERILIIDDDPVIARLLQINFRLEGFDVDAASGGEEAYRRVAERVPDLVILDVMMPGIDGFEVCRRLKEMPALQDVPFIFLSARAQDEDRTRGYALGVEEYVTKPFDPSHLVEIVRRALARRTAQA